jgi:hypothetical protein
MILPTQSGEYLMKQFVEGVDRSQATLVPERLDDWVDEDNAVRVVDVYVDGLDLGRSLFPSQDSLIS